MTTLQDSITQSGAEPGAGDVPSDEAVGEFADRMFADFLGAMNTYAATLGHRLGWYDALADVESMTSVELATATDTDERYAREWLEHQTVAGYLHVVDATLLPTERRYVLPAAQAEVLAHTESLAYMAPFASAMSTFGANLDHLVEVYRTGDGFGWDAHGDGARCGQAASNRALFLHQLPEFLASIPEIEAALTNEARVADVGCGLGWSSIGVAAAFPGVRVDGYDIDEPSITMADANAAEAGLADRVRFHAVDAAEVEADSYDVVMAYECIHDMPDPVSVLSAMRSMVRPGGSVIVMDERVDDTFTGAPNPVEQLLYGFSLICCLPDGRNADESVATGTVMRRPTFERYATDAGFAGVDVLPIEHDLFVFYRLEL